MIADEILHTTRMTADELMQEVAILLYQKDKLTLGQASRMAKMGQLQFSFCSPVVKFRFTMTSPSLMPI
jgi:predicted HTH domain antitoxin